LGRDLDELRDEALEAAEKTSDKDREAAEEAATRAKGADGSFYRREAALRLDEGDLRESDQE